MITYTTKHKARFWFAMMNASLQLVLAYYFYSKLDSWVSIVACIFVAFFIYGIFKNYSHIWEISMIDDDYKITKDGRIIFLGSSADILAINSDSMSYLIYPRKGKCIVVPRSKVDSNLHGLYQILNKHNKTLHTNP